jgi:hypothetical protein
LLKTQKHNKTLQKRVDTLNTECLRLKNLLWARWNSFYVSLMQGYVKFIRIKLNAKRGLQICGGGG